MEVYYKDLISREARLGTLVDDLMFVVQGAGELAEAADAQLKPERKAELRTQLERITGSCNRLKEHAFSSARATDKLLRRNPYSALGFAFGLGLLTGTLIYRRRS